MIRLGEEVLRVGPCPGSRRKPFDDKDEEHVPTIVPVPFGDDLCAILPTTLESKQPSAILKPPSPDPRTFSKALPECNIGYSDDDHRFTGLKRWFKVTLESQMFISNENVKAQIGLLHAAVAENMALLRADLRLSENPKHRAVKFTEGQHAPLFDFNKSWNPLPKVPEVIHSVNNCKPRHVQAAAFSEDPAFDEEGIELCIPECDVLRIPPHRHSGNGNGHHSASLAADAVQEHPTRTSVGTASLSLDPAHLHTLKGHSMSSIIGRQKADVKLEHQAHLSDDEASRILKADHHALFDEEEVTMSATRETSRSVTTTVIHPATASRTSRVSCKELVPSRKANSQSYDGSCPKSNHLGERQESFCMFHLLETMPALVIVANAITIALSADLDSNNDIWKIFEGVWIAFYTVEFVIKLKYYGCSMYFCGIERGWNWFDFLCLNISYFDLCMTYIISFLHLDNDMLGLMKTLRLARLARLVRALHFSVFDELKQMVLGVAAGVRVLMWAIVLLIVCIFFLGVATNNLIGDRQSEFNTLPNAMFTVFRCFTDGCNASDGTPLGVRLFRAYGAVFFFAYILIFMLLSVGIFNLIMAIFIDNVVCRSLKRKLQELGANQEQIELRIKETLAKLIQESHPDWAGSAAATYIKANSGESDSIEEQTSAQTRFTAGSFPTLTGRASGREGGGRHKTGTIDFLKAFTHMADRELVVSKELFGEWLENEEMNEMLADASIEVAEKQGLFDVLDVDMGGSLGLDELITGLMKLRGPTTKSDIVAVRLKVSYMTGMVEDIWNKVMERTKDSTSNSYVLNPRPSTDSLKSNSTHRVIG